MHALPGLPPSPDALIGASGGAGLGLYTPPRLVFPRLRDAVIQTFQSGHGWTLSGTTGTTYADDTSDYILGSQSVRLTTGGAGASHEIRSPVLTAIDLSASSLVLALKVDDFTHYSDIQVRLSSNGFADYAYFKPAYTSASQRWVEAGKWHIITISRAEFVAGPSWNNGGIQYSGVKGNVSWAAITGIRIKVVDDAAGQLTARFNLVGYFAPPAKAILSIVMDDGRLTHDSEARKYMDKYRMPATSAVIVDSLDSGAAYMSTAQVKRLRDTSKWAVCVHAYNNVTGTLAHQNGYDGISYADGEKDILSVKNWLHRNGFAGVNGICLPHGSWSAGGVNTSVLDLLRKYFDWARTTYANTLETYPPADPYKLRSNTVTNTDTATNLLDVVDQAIAGKAWAIMQFHNIVTPASSNTDCTPATFQAFIDGIQTRVLAGTLLVRTPQEILQYGAV